MIDLFEISETPNKKATVKITPDSGEYIDYIDIHKDDTTNHPGEWVGSLWFHDLNGAQEIWKAEEWDFIEGEPKKNTKYHAICYISAFFTDEANQVAT
jgi:hypothetical protein